MNCREFTAEFEERRNALSQTAQLHLNDCPNCKTTSGKQTRVWQMIDGLKRVDAPNDFDFRVKAKIAGANPANLQTRFFPVLRYAIPLAVIVLLFGLIAFNTSYFSGGNASQVAVTVPSTAIEKEITANNPSVNNQNISTVVVSESSAANQPNANTVFVKDTQKKQIAVVNTRKKPQTETPKKNVEEIDGISSRDSAVSEPPVTLPLGINPNQPVKTLPNVNDSNSVGDEEVLRILGIEAVRESENLKVKTVRKDSSAERSDVKVGDVIEAIDGIKLSAEPLRGKRIEVKNLTVVRGTAKIEITLKN